jgi:hypothetical protein
MVHPSYPELLKSRGWTEASSLAFVEKAGAGASVYFNFRNAKGIHLTFAVFPVEAHIRFRVYDPQTGEVRWLQIKMDHETDTVISKIVERQEEHQPEGTILFYMSISEYENISILAWEQFEDDYV